MAEQTAQPKSSVRTDVRPVRSAQPNALTYKDAHGQERTIYLPQGSMHAACDHLQNERWDELAKFESYTGQGYQASDFKPIGGETDGSASRRDSG